MSTNYAELAGDLVRIADEQDKQSRLCNRAPLEVSKQIRKAADALLHAEKMRALLVELRPVFVEHSAYCSKRYGPTFSCTCNHPAKLAEIDKLIGETKENGHG